MNLKDSKFTAFFHRALAVPLIGFLKLGLSPEKLALTIAFGIVLGIVPVIGVTTILCALAAFLFRLNMPAIQLINYFVAPLQLIFLIPFIRAGEFLFRDQPLPLNVYQIIGMIQTDVMGAVNFLWWTTMHAIVAWLVIGAPLLIILYIVFVPIVRRLVSRPIVAE